MAKIVPLSEMSESPVTRLSVVMRLVVSDIRTLSQAKLPTTVRIRKNWSQ